LKKQKEIHHLIKRKVFSYLDQYYHSESKNIKEYYRANKSGDMTVKVETDTAQVATYFTGLQGASNIGDDESHSGIPTTQQSSISSTDSLDTAEVRLDIKKFAQLLHSQQPHAEKMVFST
jgi:hypothetical protein